MRTPRPARQTGRMRAFSRRDVTGCELTSGLEPGELVERVPGELTRDCRDEHEDRQHGNQLRFPLQHPLEPPKHKDARLADSSFEVEAAHPPYGGFSEISLLTEGNESGLGEGTTPPREAVFVPTGEGRDGDAVVRRVNEPTVAEVDAHVVYLRGLRRRAVGSEEDDVGGLELLERDALRGGHFSAHRVRRPALEHVREGAPVRVLLDLVDAPDESRAVEAAVDLRPERRVGGFGELALPTPDVR